MGCLTASVAVSVKDSDLRQPKHTSTTMGVPNRHLMRLGMLLIVCLGKKPVGGRCAVSPRDEASVGIPFMFWSIFCR